jgi:hypothetical protein
MFRSLFKSSRGSRVTASEARNAYNPAEVQVDHDDMLRVLTLARAAIRKHMATAHDVSVIYESGDTFEDEIDADPDLLKAQQLGEAVATRLREDGFTVTVSKRLSGYDDGEEESDYIEFILTISW